MPPIIFQIDAFDAIIYTSDAWDSFCLANDGPAAASASVVGRSMWDFIADSSTRALYRALTDQVRSENITVKFPYRCDSPGLRRYMTMEVRPGRSDVVAFINRIIREEPVSPALRFRAVDPDLGLPAGPTVIRCSLCTRLASDRQWFEPADLLSRRGVMSGDEPVRVAYGVCETCRMRVHTGRLPEGRATA